MALLVQTCGLRTLSAEARQVLSWSGWLPGSSALETHSGRRERRVAGSSACH